MVDTFTAMFSHPNLHANLSRQFFNIRQGTTTGKLYHYALRISSGSSGLLIEVKRTAPPTQSRKTFAWERSKIAVFENGLPPAIINEQVP